MFKKENYEDLKVIKKELFIVSFILLLILMVDVYLVYLYNTVLSNSSKAIVIIIAIIMVFFTLSFMSDIFIDKAEEFFNFSSKIKEYEKGLMKDNFSETYELYIKALDNKN